MMITKTYTVDNKLKTVNVLVHEFNVGDVDELELTISDIIYKWQQTDLGRWVSENCEDQLSWTSSINIETYGYAVKIRAVLSEENAVIFTLKYH